MTKRVAKQEILRYILKRYKKPEADHKYSEPHEIHSRRLKSKIRNEIRTAAKKQFVDLANKETGGELLATWVVSLLENSHLYDWYEEDQND
jgi:hypothetical protein